MKIKLTYFEDIFGWGGIETFICNVCSRIDTQKYDIRIVAINKTTDHFDKLLSDKHIKMEVLISEFIPNPLKRFRKGLPLFDKYIKNNPCDIIHFNLSDSIDLLYVRLAKKHGIKHRFVHSHNSSATNIYKKVVHVVGKALFSGYATDYIACSKKAAQWLFDNEVVLEKKYTYIRNAIDTKDYIFDQSKRNNIRNVNGWNDKFVCLNVARFNKQKNHSMLISIFEEVLKIRNNAILVLVGEGSLKKDVERLVVEKGLVGKVVFWGATSDIPSMLLGADVFILPSLYEGLPFVLVESQAASLPSIVSDTITRDIAVSKYIKYVGLNVSFSEWAEDVLEFSNIERDNKIDKLINEGFDISVMVKQLDSLYTEAVKND